MNPVRTVFSLLAVLSCLAASGCGRPNATTSPRNDGRSSGAQPVLKAQALRTCVDRWNQANMLGWGPALVRVGVRQVGAAQLAAVGLRNPHLQRCAVSLSFEFRTDPRTGCSGASPAPRKPKMCVYRSSTFTCVLDRYGAYACPVRHEPSRTPLQQENAITDEHGVMSVDVPIDGTHAVQPLTWARRYPHADGWIEPWTSSGKLRPGLRFVAHPFTKNYRGGGSCATGSELTQAKSAIRCLWRRMYVVDPCFPETADWPQASAVAACPDWPGGTTFARFIISGRS